MSAPARPAVRLHWLDWLRVVAVLGIVFYHCALPWVGTPWLITNKGLPVLPLAALAGVGFLFGMPLVFLVSGAATAFSLKPGGAAGYVKARVFRLLVPMVVGIILLSPFQAYLHELSVGKTEESFISFAPQWLRSIELFFNPTWFGTYGYHLWFLGFLFSYSVLALPFFVWLRSPAGDRAWAWFLRVCQTPLGLLLPLLPLCVVNVLFRAAFPSYGNWADFFLWLGFFVVGYVFTGRSGFFAAIRARWRTNLALTLGCLLLFAIFGLTGDLMKWVQNPSYTLGYAFYNVLSTFAAWSMVLLSLAVAMDYLNRTNPTLQYLNEAVLPVYVIHHPIVVLFAYLTVQSGLPPVVEFYLTAIPAIGVTFLVYELGIRRWSVPRWLFGLKPRRTGATATPQQRTVAPPMPEAVVAVAAARFDGADQARAAIAVLDTFRRERGHGLGSCALVTHDDRGKAVFNRHHVADARAGAAVGAVAGVLVYLGIVLVVFAHAAAAGLQVEHAGAVAVDLLLTAVLYAGTGAALGVVLGALRNMAAGIPSGELEELAHDLDGGQAAVVVRTRPDTSATVLAALQRAGGRPLGQPSATLPEVALPADPSPEPC